MSIILKNDQFGISSNNPILCCNKQHYALLCVKKCTFFMTTKKSFQIWQDFLTTILFLNKSLMKIIFDKVQYKFWENAY